jgi:hypothetical protein
MAAKYPAAVRLDAADAIARAQPHRRLEIAQPARRVEALCGIEADTEEVRVASPERRGGIGGISVGGIIVIVGIVLIFVWSFWIGLIIALVGLIAFGGFARGKWY